MASPDVCHVFLESTRFRFQGTKDLGDRALSQLADADFTWQPDPQSSSIAVIIQHLHGNMLSRWTDFLHTDGEKESRDRDAEFVEPSNVSRIELLKQWDEGWECLLDALRVLTTDDLLKAITIRGQQHSVLDAIHRQLAHVPYHVGQIVYIARMRKGSEWQTLSIPKGQSRSYKP